MGPKDNRPAWSYRSWNEQPFSTSTTLLLTLSVFLIGIGLAVVVGFVGQVAAELPYHLRWRRQMSASPWAQQAPTSPSKPRILP